MTTTTNRLLLCTLASLIALTASAFTTGMPRWLWAVWAVLALVTVWVVATDSRSN
ncbi:hypothetical protein [Streptomyces albipurpureus]|uniref:Uncharacterized protein n=1 Tax=Streptomyces albipurpureus TaxID=2897419 RepID=A0ABT0UM24_9ACTN|nr:hypothetical protein [Streptomyces sp. CWNU-1]MCM2388675.1 hypothetical protein [Streptomyces sp. CWNU-1]